MLVKNILFFVLISSFVGCAQTLPLKKASLNKKIFKVKWSKNLDPIHNAGNLPIGTASPLIDEDILYIGSLSGVMHAFDLESGRLIWQKDEKQAINAKATRFKDSVIYGSKFGRFFSRHYLTGKLNYAIDLGASIESSPVVYAGRMFLHLRNHRIVALDASTGKIIWSYKRSVPYTTTLQRVSKVLPYGNNIIVGFADGYVGAISINEGIIVWEQKLSNKHKFIDVDLDPVVFANSVVLGSANGDLSFVNPDNGLVNRSYRLTLSAKPLKLDGRLIVGSLHGDLMVINEDLSIGTKKNISEDAITSIAHWRGNIVASTLDGKIIAVDKIGFDKKDTFDLGTDYSTVFGQIVQSNDHLAVYSSRNRLYIFQ